MLAYLLKDAKVEGCGHVLTSERRFSRFGMYVPFNFFAGFWGGGPSESVDIPGYSLELLWISSMLPPPRNAESETAPNFIVGVGGRSHATGYEFPA